MDETAAVAGFAALANATRLKLFRLLIAAGPEGLAAGRLAEALEISPSNLSAHLAALSRAGLVAGRAEGRARIYAVDMGRAGALVRYLVEDCCQGRPEVCAPVLDAAAPRC
ncbi:MAG: metalloregulator ArsR/SmtB family transcription factor [Oceanicaulis sp.]